MAKIKLPEPGPLANFVQIVKNTKEKPCAGGNLSALCNTTTVMTAYTLTFAGSNLLKMYNGPKCPHGYPTSAGAMAYMLDNFASHAIKAPCTPEWKNLLRGSVAILMYHNVWGEKVHLFDIWSIDKCAFYPELFNSNTAKELWIWPLGKAPKLHTKKTRHHRQKAAMIF